MVYFISDTHFHHSNIIKYCNRPFKDINEMNEIIISNWNNIVKKDDIVYHLGDFCLSSDDYPKNYTEKKHINLSVDATNFKPLSLDEIMRRRSKNND